MLRKICACDLDGICPYGAGDGRDCAYWCSADEPEDWPDDYYDDEDEDDGWPED